MRSPKQPLTPRLPIRTQAPLADTDAAIREAAQLLSAAGRNDPAYAPSLLRREAVSGTDLGHGVVPHGMADDRHLVRASDIAALQIPDGLVWHDGQVAHLVVALALQSDTHKTILRRLAGLASRPGSR